MATPIPVQSVGNAATANVSSISVTLTPTSGNTLIAAVVARNLTTGVTGPSGWTKAIEVISSSFATSIWYLENYSGSGAQTYTWTMAASDSMEVIVREVSGLATSGSLDQTASNTSAGVATNPVDSGTTATTTQASEFWVAAMGSSGTGNRTISGVTAGWTQGLTENSSTATHPTHLTDLYQVASATGVANAEFTLSTAQVWNGAVATFKAASGGTTVYGQAESAGGGQGAAASALYDAGQSVGNGTASSGAASVFGRSESDGGGSAVGQSALSVRAQSAGAGAASGAATISTAGISDGAGTNVAPLTGVWLWALGESDGRGLGIARATVTIPTPPAPDGVSLGWATTGPMGASVAVIVPSGVALALIATTPSGVSVT